MKINKEDIEKEREIISELQQQLAEKNKEINKLSKEHSEMFRDMKEYKNLWLAEQRKNKQIRQQVCNEIEKIALLNRDDNYVITDDDLDEIRKGEIRWIIKN